MHFTKFSLDQFVAEDALDSVNAEWAGHTFTSPSSSISFHKLLITSDRQENVWKTPFFSCNIFLQSPLCKQCKFQNLLEEQFWLFSSWVIQEKYKRNLRWWDCWGWVANHWENVATLNKIHLWSIKKLSSAIYWHKLMFSFCFCLILYSPLI